MMRVTGHTFALFCLLAAAVLHCSDAAALCGLPKNHCHDGFRLSFPLDFSSHPSALRRECHCQRARVCVSGVSNVYAKEDVRELLQKGIDFKAVQRAMSATDSLRDLQTSFRQMDLADCDTASKTAKALTNLVVANVLVLLEHTDSEKHASLKNALDSTASSTEVLQSIYAAVPSTHRAYTERQEKERRDNAEAEMRRVQRAADEEQARHDTYARDRREATLAKLSELGPRGL